MINMTKTIHIYFENILSVVNFLVIIIYFILDF
jgi:hypothetical protein